MLERDKDVGTQSRCIMKGMIMISNKDALMLVPEHEGIEQQSLIWHICLPKQPETDQGRKDQSHRWEGGKDPVPRALSEADESVCKVDQGYGGSENNK